MFHQSTPFFLSLAMCISIGSGVSVAQESDVRDFQSTLDRLAQADKKHISTLHESYLHSIELLGIDDPYTAQLRDRLLFESNPAALINEVSLIDIVTDFHAQSDADIQTTTAQILDLWKRFEEHVEANPHPTETVWLNMAPPGGRYPSGIAPSDIKEPDIRAAYEEMLRKNRINAIRLNRAVRAEQAQKRFVSHLKLIVLVMSQDLSKQERNDLLNAIEASDRTGADELLKELRAKLP